MMYRMLSPWTTTQAQLEEALARARFAPCAAAQEKSVGWVEPRGQAHGALVEVVDGQWLLEQALETKSVPASVVKRRLEDRVAQIEAASGRKPGKKERRDLADDIRQTLLPQAFSKQASTLVWIDPKAARVLLDAGSQARADEAMTALVNAIEGLVVQPVDSTTAPATAMAHWLSSQEAPAGFSIDRECELKAPDESRAVVRYTRHALDIDEVRQHIAQGKMPTRLAMTWNGRLSFVLTEALQLRRLALLDHVLEDRPQAAGDRQEDDFDTDVALVTGELRRLLPDLLAALDGEAAPTPDDRPPMTDPR